jgi:hypothetical protein
LTKPWPSGYTDAEQHHALSTWPTSPKCHPESQLATALPTPRASRIDAADTLATCPSAQGKVKALHRLDSGIILADIAWNKPGLPMRVNVKNLCCLG